MAKLIQTFSVNSSNIKEVGYSEVNQILQVNFYSGSWWQYKPITLDEYTDLRLAPSIGKHFVNNIRNRKDLIALEVKARAGRPKKKIIR